MYKLTIPPAVVVNKTPYHFRSYLSEVIMPLPFWRSREGIHLTEQLFELIDGDKESQVVSDGLHEALCSQMSLSDRGLGQLNPQLARCAIVFARAVYNAEKTTEKT